MKENPIATYKVIEKNIFLMHVFELYQELYFWYQNDVVMMNIIVWIFFMLHAYFYSVISLFKINWKRRIFQDI